MPKSRRADYILVDDSARPSDAIGKPLLRNDVFELWRARPGIPGRDNCSRDAVETVTTIEGPD